MWFKKQYIQEHGVAVERCTSPGKIRILCIVATPDRGKGAAGGWLDKLPCDRVIEIPHVINPTLVGMLERRGFQPSGWTHNRPASWVRPRMSPEALADCLAKGQTKRQRLDVTMVVDDNGLWFPDPVSPTISLVNAPAPNEVATKLPVAPVILRKVIPDRQVAPNQATRGRQLLGRGLDFGGL